MKQMIKNFLFKKRIKILKSKKGFSLLEVLIGVAIIGIISAIAVPQFAEYRTTAAVTAVGSTGDNLAKAYNLCTATRTSCTTLDEIKMKCDICGTPQNGSEGFCVPISQKVQNQTFKSCVQIKSDGTVLKSFGGQLKVCWYKHPGGKDLTVSTAGDNAASFVPKTSLIKTCEVNDDCSPPTGYTASHKECKANAGGGSCASNGECT